MTEHDVLPIFLLRCNACHGATYQEGGLDLRSRASILKGGESGPALVPGDPEKSLLFQKIHDDDMPPEENRGTAGIEDVTPEEMETIRNWIVAGAPETPPVAFEPQVSEKDREHWAFRSPKQATVPSVEHADRVANAIDAFLLEKLEANDLAFSPEADRVTLLRRASYALTGLPPSPEETRRFAADRDPRAWEKLIDHLLESPRYGERWARVWLDVAGYADSEGKRHADMIRRHAWRYRDYVIRAFNDDKPYDRFLLEQLAGDELAGWENATELTPELYDNLVATGFLRQAPDGTTANPVNRPEDRLEVITDELRVLTEGVMGLTMECARCHDHKYDPLSQRDYYQLSAVFKGAYDEYEWMTPQGFNNQWKKSKQRLLPLALPEERAAWEAEIAAIDAKIEPLKKQVAALGKDKEAADEKKKLEKEIKSLEDSKPTAPMIRALWDRGQPSNTYLLERGNHLQPAALVEPDVPEVFAATVPPYKVEKPGPGTMGTGRRLAFAKWLTHPDHPLTARVIVNRVWAQHFGTGLVKSLDNFGVLGDPPSHPELLDWLAVEFVKNGWSLKWLHRQILATSAWRQVSTVTEEQARLDPDNRLVSRMPLRRLDAEEVRDAVLAVSGVLDPTPFGEPDPVEVRQDGLVTGKFLGADKKQPQLRRSLYLRHRRKEMPTILETFDQPAMNPNCVERSQSTIVTQPLHLLNNARIRELAGHFARRVATEASGDPAGQVEHAWVLALNRVPDNDEIAAGVEALAAFTATWAESLAESGSDDSPEQRALEDFCHTLINSAAFLYLD